MLAICICDAIDAHKENINVIFFSALEGHQQLYR